MKIGNKPVVFACTLIFILGVLLSMDSSVPEAIDWSSSYRQKDKKPYGSYLLYQSLMDIFPKQKINLSYKTVFEVLRERKIYNFNYIFINRSFSPQRTDARALLRFVNEGGSVFIAAEWFEGIFADSLEIGTNHDFLDKDAISLNFVAQEIRKESAYQYRQNSVPYYFESYQRKQNLILAKNSKNKAVLLRIRYGKGVFYLCTVPLAFTNYNLLLNENADFIAKALSFLPIREIFWDEYYKVGREELKSPLRFILNRESLTWAFYLTLATVFLFVLSEGRRKQRAIPVIEKLKNSTLEFVEVIGNLYHQYKDHKI